MERIFALLPPQCELKLKWELCHFLCRTANMEQLSTVTLAHRFLYLIPHSADIWKHTCSKWHFTINIFRLCYAPLFL